MTLDQHALLLLLTVGYANATLRLFPRLTFARFVMLMGAWAITLAALAR